MTIALVGDQWWRRACEAAGIETVTLPSPAAAGQPYTADIAARTRAGEQWAPALREQQPQLVLDNGGTGLALTPDPTNPESVKILHEQVGVPLASHWIDPIVLAFQGLPWGVVWQALQSQSWHKFMWDKPQTAELMAMGVPNVHYLPMAAWDREYNTDPVDPETIKHIVSFVGGQNTSYFMSQHQVTGDKLLVGALAQAVRAAMQAVSFFDIYFHLYQLGEPLKHFDSVEARMQKSLAYYQHKLFYNALRCIHQRDRFVIFLKQKLGETFTLIGERWDSAYNLSCQPPLPTTEAYLNHFRETAINLNLVNGNSDSGLNMRHFEITAAGGFMLCYHQDEIEEFFQIGVECDTFRNEQELLDKIRHYLEHPDQRVAIAQAGQQRTLREHLYSHRLQQLLSAMPQAAAPGAQLVEGAAS